jgi:hypothetical protein
MDYDALTPMALADQTPLANQTPIADQMRTYGTQLNQIAGGLGTLADQVAALEVSGPVESADGTMITSVGPEIYDATLTSWAISAGAQVVCEDVVDGSSHRVNALYYKKSDPRPVYHRNTDGNWYSSPAGHPPRWTGPVADPTQPAPPTSTTLVLGTSGAALTVDLSVKTGKPVSQGVWGVSTSECGPGDNNTGSTNLSNQKFQQCLDTRWQATMKSTGLHCLRLNWDNGVPYVIGNGAGRTGIWQSRAAWTNNTPDWSWIDNFVNTLTGWIPSPFWLVITVGIPDWMTLNSSGDQAIWGQMLVKISQRFEAKGHTPQYWEVVNERDDTDHTLLGQFAVAGKSALQAHNPNAYYKMGGPCDTYVRTDKIQQFVAAGHPDFVVWHTYIIGQTSGQTMGVPSAASNYVNRNSGDVRNARSVVPAGTPLGMTEWNVDYNVVDPLCSNQGGAVVKAAGTIAALAADDLFQFTCWWDLDLTGSASAQVNNDFSPRPTLIALGHLGNTVYGARCPISGTLPANVAAIGTEHGILFANYGTTDVPLRLTVKLPVAATGMSRWEQSPARQNGAAAALSPGAPLVIPPGAS